MLRLIVSRDCFPRGRSTKALEQELGTGLAFQEDGCELAFQPRLWLRPQLSVKVFHRCLVSLFVNLCVNTFWLVNFPSMLTSHPRVPQKTRTKWLKFLTFEFLSQLTIFLVYNLSLVTRQWLFSLRARCIGIDMLFNLLKSVSAGRKVQNLLLSSRFFPEVWGFLLRISMKFLITNMFYAIRW